MHSPDKTLRVVKVLFCPGFERYGKDIVNMATNTCYAITQPAPNGLAFLPFGYPPTGVQQPPHKLSDVRSKKPLADVWILMDVDKVLKTDPGNDWQGQLPDKP